VIIAIKQSHLCKIQVTDESFSSSWNQLPESVRQIGRLTVSFDEAEADLKKTYHVNHPGSKPYHILSSEAPLSLKIFISKKVKILKISLNYLFFSMKYFLPIPWRDSISRTIAPVSSVDHATG
jgi:hypothetical protein